MNPFNALRDVRMCTKDDVCSRLRQRIRQHTHAFRRFRAVFCSPMRQNDNDVCAVYSRTCDILRHFLRIYQRKHAAGIVFRLRFSLITQAVRICKHGDLYAVYIHHRRASVFAVWVNARIRQRTAGQLAEGQIQPVISPIQRAFRRQRDQIHAARAKRIENLRRRIIIAVSLFASRRRRFKRNDG